MEPTTIAALIQGGASLLGGFLGTQGGNSPGGKDGFKEAQLQRQMKYNKDWAGFSSNQNRNDTRFLNENMASWQVQGARKAGLHPLFALGGGAALAPSPAMSVLDPAPSNRRNNYDAGDAVRDMGQAVARGVAGTQTAQQKEAAILTLEMMRQQVRKESAIADYYGSEASRARQSNVSTKALPSMPGLNVNELDNFHDRVQPKANEVISARQSDKQITAGANPMFSEYYLTNDKNHSLRVLLPYSQEGPTEALETMHLGNPATLALVYQANKSKYGAAHAREIVRFLLTGNVFPENVYGGK